ncbi:COX6B-domain-containing protein [Cucurbitaria berberidis CBS 394.84]|uniref:Cytochrome c oxidase subunit 12, mitochondrial n=1 Tax=Cucurbitaria berberidis CBS 394.84 TaxID=1168544 RepID=A0A9P4GU53_9PLEO|nr:COX6B-domain-containing protein [Cucurbitaria berberidis CBS 394.84]KAF1851867.1 COX6B-domain-containing protein [Cucurbitaria berberidis CBS 394.84]
MSDNENGDELVTKPFKFVTAPTAPPNHVKYNYPKLGICDKGADEPRRSLGFDARFPNQNQTKHCWQNYVDYHKCTIAKGEDFAPCRQFLLAYKSLCPSGWTSRWDDQREAGNFPVKLDQ